MGKAWGAAAPSAVLAGRSVLAVLADAFPEGASEGVPGTAATPRIGARRLLGGICISKDEAGGAAVTAEFLLLEEEHGGGGAQDAGVWRRRGAAPLSRVSLHWE